MFKKREEIERIKETYPIGTKIELIQMNEDPNPVPSGTKGEVRLVDGIGQIHTNWENGRTLPVIVGVDEFVVIK